MDFTHTSVLPELAVEMLNCRPGGIYVDCTLGGGGHARKILKKIEPGGKFIGIDQDIRAIEHCQNYLQGYDVQLWLIHTNFLRLKETVTQLIGGGVNGILFDLGVSSPQLDEGNRGFSYKQDAPLDMRMDNRVGWTAKDLVNESSEEQLNKMIWDYGEERWARRIAQFIVEERRKNVIETTGQLVDVIKKAIPAGARKDGPHPAKRTFQALRIAVNDELGVLKTALQDSIDLLQPGGRISVITFHSLEDRITKEIFKNHSKACICPPELPICQCSGQPGLKIVTKKPILPSDEEVGSNPRSRSAKLRVAEKLVKV